jgi:hypothetical protein
MKWRLLGLLGKFSRSSFFNKALMKPHLFGEHQSCSVIPILRSDHVCDISMVGISVPEAIVFGILNFVDWITHQLLNKRHDATLTSKGDRIVLLG